MPATRVPSANDDAARASGRSPPPGSPAPHRREDRREQVRQVRDAGDGQVVLVGRSRDDARAAGPGELGDVAPDVEVEAVVGGHHPRRSAEQLRVACRPPRLGGAGHGVRAHVARPRGVPVDGVRDRDLDAHRVGQPAGRRDGVDAAQHVRQRRQRHGQHDQRIRLGGPAQRGVGVDRDVEPVGAGLGGRGLRSAGAPDRPAGLLGGPQQRPADQPGADHADRTFRHEQ